MPACPTLRRQAGHQPLVTMLLQTRDRPCTCCGDGSWDFGDAYKAPKGFCWVGLLARGLCVEVGISKTLKLPNPSTQSQWPWRILPEGAMARAVVSFLVGKAQ